MSNWVVVSNFGNIIDGTFSFSISNFTLLDGNVAAKVKKRLFFLIKFSRIAFFSTRMNRSFTFSRVIEKSLNAFYAIHMTRMSRKIAIHEISTNRLKLTCSIDACH